MFSSGGLFARNFVPDLRSSFCYNRSLDLAVSTIIAPCDCNN